jgi:hypothetical protein
MVVGLGKIGERMLKEKPPRTEFLKKQAPGKDKNRVVSTLLGSRDYPVTISKKHKEDLCNWPNPSGDLDLK